MNLPNRNIFRGYDVRGIYPTDLNEDVAEIVGRAIGSFYLRHSIHLVVVGKDNRLSSDSLQEALINGLLSSGCDVVNVGLTLTPMIYFAWYGMGADASINVTASHNPAEYNGFKVTFKRNIIKGEDLLKIIDKGDFLTGQGEVRSGQLKDDYFEKILEGLSFSKKLKVVIDAGNGTAGVFAPDLFRKIGSEVIELHCESIGSFPNHTPYPQHEEYYEDMIELVKKNNADLGIALDGDADRFNVCDEKGIFAGSDYLINLFVRDILKERKGKIIVTTLASQGTTDYIKSLGGEVVMWKVGYANLQEKIQEEKAIFAGEESGHMFFADRYLGYDDALYTSVRVAELLSKTQKPLSILMEEIRNEVPKYISTKEYRIDCPDEMKFEVVQDVLENLKKNFEVVDIDGVRFQMDGGWGIVRASHTEPVLSIRAEGKTEEKLSEAKSVLSQALEKFKPKVDLVWD